MAIRRITLVSGSVAGGLMTLNFSTDGGASAACVVPVNAGLRDALYVLSREIGALRDRGFTWQQVADEYRGVTLEVDDGT